MTTFKEVDRSAKAKALELWLATGDKATELEAELNQIENQARALHREEWEQSHPEIMAEYEKAMDEYDLNWSGVDLDDCRLGLCDLMNDYYGGMPFDPYSVEFPNFMTWR